MYNKDDLVVFTDKYYKQMFEDMPKNKTVHKVIGHSFVDKDEGHGEQLSICKIEHKGEHQYINVHWLELYNPSDNNHLSEQERTKENEVNKSNEIVYGF